MVSSEDILRLNTLIVLCDAIRIDEYKMCVFGLDKNQAEQKVKKERKIQLNPTGDQIKYLNAVRDLLATKILGVMGGYPAYLKRWSSLGNVSVSNLQALLKLGNIGAVVAVANTPSLPADILPLVWWSATNTDEQSEIACYLLVKPEVLAHPVKVEIVDYLLEFLPFITEFNALISTVNLLLQAGLLNQKKVEKLWQQGQRKTVFLVGFLERRANQLPLVGIKPLIRQEQDIAQLEEVNTEQGQLFLQTSALILKKINQEDVLYRTLEALGKYCVHPMIKPTKDIQALQAQVNLVMQEFNPSQYQDKIYARLLLAGVSEQLVVSHIARYALAGSAIGKKLAHIFVPIQTALATLLS